MNEQNFLSSPRHIHVIGSKPLGERPLGERLKSLAQKGVLSMLLMAQVVNVFAAPSAPAPAPNSPPAATAQINSDRLPEPILFNPFQENKISAHFVMDNGLVDGFELVRHWRNEGIEMNEIYELTEVLLAAQSPTIVTTQSELAAARKLAERTQDIFSVQTQKQAEEFLKSNSMSALERSGFLPEGTGLVFDRDAVNPELLTFDHVANLWQASSIMDAGENAQPFFAAQDQSPTQVQDAVASLAQSVQEAGLSNVRMPVSMWTSSQSITHAATLIKNANLELQQITGWEGPVLGLNGQLGMTMSGPYNTAIMQSNLSGTGLQLSGRVNDLAHEYLHAVETSIAKHIGLQSDQFDQPVLLQARARHQTSGEAHLWNETFDEMEKTSYELEHSWSASMDQKSIIIASGSHPSFGPERAEYFNHQHERMAYNFASYALYKLGDQSVLGNKVNTAPGDFQGPSVQEAAAQDGHWQSLFSSLKQTSWHQNTFSPRSSLSATLDQSDQINQFSDDLSAVVLSAGSSLKAKLLQNRENLHTHPAPAKSPAR